MPTAAHAARCLSLAVQRLMCIEGRGHPREIHTTSAFRSRRWLVGRPRSASEQFLGYFPSFIDDAQHFLNDRNMEHRGQRGVTLVLPFFGPFARTVPKR